MKKIATIIICLLLTAIALAQQYEEVVFLKNGSVIRGIVIETVPGVSLKIQTKDGNIFVYQMDEVEKVTKELVQTKQTRGSRQTEYIGGEKSTILAVLLSAIIPGMGQYYNGDVGKGIIMNVLWVGGIALAVTVGISEEEHSYSYWNGYDYTYNYYYTEEITAAYWIGLGITVATSLWSMIDAGVSASAYNDRLREEQENYGHMLEYRFKKNVVLGLDASPTPKGVYGGVTLHF